jgi:hypothetical protein
LIEKMTSNRESSVGGSSICSAIVLSLENRPHFGFAAASTGHRAFRVEVIPAFAIETVCCSSASCIAERSSGLILSSSSMTAMPPSARTSSPASRTQRPPAKSSFTAAAVSPAAVAPFPLV